MGNGTARAVTPAAISLAVTIAVAVVALWPSFAALIAAWQQVHDYQHGPLIAVISVAWLAAALHRWQGLPLRGSTLGASLLGVFLAAWLVMHNANSLIAHELLTPIALFLVVVAAGGWVVARHLIAPLAYLYFAIPIWEYLLPALQRLSVLATETALGLAGVPAIIREYTVTIPEGTFQIVEGCSGKRYFMVTLAVAVLAAFMNHIRGWRCAGFLAACAGLALLANWVRIFVVIYAGHVTHMQHYLVAQEHDSFGNGIFVVLLGSVLLLGRRLAATPVIAPGHGSPRHASESAPGLAVRYWRIGLTLALLGTTFVLVQARAAFVGEPPVLGELPLTVDRWQGPLPPATDWMPHYVQPVNQRRAAYSSPAGAVEVYVNLYGEQEQGRELVFFENTLLAPDGWVRAWPHRTLRLAGGPGPSLTSFQAQSEDGRRWLIAYTYDVGGWRTGSELGAQLAYGTRSIVRPVPSGVVALAAPCGQNCESAQALVASFWGDMSSRVLAMLPHGGIRASASPARN